MTYAEERRLTLIEIKGRIAGKDQARKDRSADYERSKFHRWIMPEPTAFLSKQFPACSIIRPTATKGAAMGAVKGLTADRLFIGQSQEFFAYLRDLAEDADEARRER